MHKNIGLVRNYRPNDFGGAEKYQIELAKGLKLNGFNPTIITSSLKLQEEAKKQDFSVIKAPFLIQQNWSGYRNLFLPIYFFWQIYLYFWYRRIIKKNQIDVLHLQSRDDLIAGTLAGKHLKKRIIWTDHADFRAFIFQNINLPLKNFIGKYIYRLSKKVHHVTTISHYEKTAIERILAPRKIHNLSVIYNGVYDFYQQKSSTVVSKNAFVFGFVGRICQEKGIEELLVAFQKLQSEKSNILLKIYGTGEEEYLTKLKTQYISPNIQWCGFVSDIKQAFQSFDIFVLPTYKEGLSLSILEAMMMQKIIITTDIPENHELIQDQRNGYLVKVKDPEDLYLKFIEIIGSPEKSEAFAKIAREDYLAQFNFSKIIQEQIIPLYQEDYE